MGPARLYVAQTESTVTADEPLQLSRFPALERARRPLAGIWQLSRIPARGLEAPPPGAG